MATRRRRATPDPGERPSAESLLARFPEPVRALAEEVRAFVRASIPTFDERVYASSAALGYHDAQAGSVCNLFLMPDHVCLAFERGAELDDPDGLFAPPGRKKAVRYVEIRALRDLRQRALRAMLQRAIVNQSV